MRRLSSRRSRRPGQSWGTRSGRVSVVTEGAFTRPYNVRWTDSSGARAVHRVTTLGQCLIRTSVRFAAARCCLLVFAREPAPRRDLGLSRDQTLGSIYLAGARDERDYDQAHKPGKRIGTRGLGVQPGRALQPWVGDVPVPALRTPAVYMPGRECADRNYNRLFAKGGLIRRIARASQRAPKGTRGSLVEVAHDGEHVVLVEALKACRDQFPVRLLHEVRGTAPARHRDRP